MHKKSNHKSPRARLMSALFKKAADRGISQEDLRDNISLQVNGKRLSKSSLNEIGRVIDYITGKPTPTSPHLAKGGTKGGYDLSLNGLKEEIKDLAITRWGDAWEDSLNKFCKSFGADRWQFLNIGTGKVVKKRLIELSRKDAESAEAL